MSENYQKGIRKLNSEIKKSQTKLTRAKEKNMCKCLHTRKGELDLVPSNMKRGNGAKMMLCVNCNKDVQVNRVPKETAVKEHNGNFTVNVGREDAVNAVDSMMDIIKMNLNPENEKDREFIKQIAEAQFLIRNRLITLYEASLQNTAGGKGGRRKGKRPSTSSADNGWRQPAFND